MALVGVQVAARGSPMAPAGSSLAGTWAWAARGSSSTDSRRLVRFNQRCIAVTIGREVSEKREHVMQFPASRM
ncbi:hypothetical protein GCM10028824_13320 [Hymenobacter segetis]